MRLATSLIETVGDAKRNTYHLDSGWPATVRATPASMMLVRAPAQAQEWQRGQSSLIGKEMFIVYHSHADPTKITRDRVVNIDRLVFDEAGRLKVVGPTRDPKPMPSGSR